jgi:GTPase
VLADLGADTKQMLVVFNKMDRVDDPSAKAVLRLHFPEAVFVSVHTGQGIEELVEHIADFVSDGTTQVELRLPLARADILARLHREGGVHEVTYEDDIVRVRATLAGRLVAELDEFRVKRPAKKSASAKAA